MEKISLYVVPTKEISKTALEILKKELPGADTEVIGCPESMEKMYPLPFVRYEGLGYFGLLGIREFAESFRKKN